jgi:outer membrane protein assembly factor BamB
MSRFSLLIFRPLSCILALALLPHAHGQDWLRFRGTNGSGIGVAPGLSVTWTEKDYRWRVDLPGKGHSSPIICGKRLFVTAGDETSGGQTVRCLNAAAGATVWTREFTAATYKKNPANAYASSTPTADQERLYVTWATPEKYWVVALDQQSGKDIWRRDLGPFEAQHGFGASPILVRDILVVPDEQDGVSRIVGLDCRSGEIRWQTPRRTEKAAYSTPCLYESPGNPPQLILTSWAHGFSSLDPQSGKSNWELPLLKFRVVGSPLLAGDLILACCGTGGSGKQMFAVRAGGPKHQAEVAFELKPPIPYVPTPVADAQRAYLWGDSGIVTCVALPDGKVLWQERVGGNYFSSPLLIAGRVYGVSRTGQVVVLAAAERYELLGRSELGEACHSTPAVAGGVLYFRTVSHVMALGPAK